MGELLFAETFFIQKPGSSKWPDPKVVIFLFLRRELAETIKIITHYR
jgi:hypothetical protein